MLGSWMHDSDGSTKAFELSPNKLGEEFLYIYLLIEAVRRGRIVDRPALLPQEVLP